MQGVERLRVASVRWAPSQRCMFWVGSGYQTCLEGVSEVSGGGFRGLNLYLEPGGGGGTITTSSHGSASSASSASNNSNNSSRGFSRGSSHGISPKSGGGSDGPGALLALIERPMLPQDVVPRLRGGFRRPLGEATALAAKALPSVGHGRIQDSAPPFGKAFESAVQRVGGQGSRAIITSAAFFHFQEWKKQ